MLKFYPSPVIKSATCPEPFALNPLPKRPRGFGCFESMNGPAVFAPPSGLSLAGKVPQPKSAEGHEPISHFRIDRVFKVLFDQRLYSLPGPRTTLPRK